MRFYLAYRLNKVRGYRAASDIHCNDITGMLSETVHMPTLRNAINLQKETASVNICMYISKIVRTYIYTVHILWTIFMYTFHTCILKHMQKMFP